MSRPTREEKRARVVFAVRLRNEYTQRLSNVEGIHAIMAEYANTPDREQEAREWLEKGIAALDEWYRIRLKE